MTENPFIQTYGSDRYARVGWRGKYAVNERLNIAKTRAYERKLAIEARATDKSDTVACVVAWLNQTFDPQYYSIQDLPMGAKGADDTCPIAIAIATMLDVAAVAVDGATVSIPYGDEYYMPACASRFVRLFDAGYFPQYEDPMYDDDAYNEEDR